jgi:hypothetical protein
MNSPPILHLYKANRSQTGKVIRGTIEGDAVPAEV